MERLRLSEVYDEVVKDMVVLRVDMNTFNTMFGCKIEKLIPFQLNDVVTQKYYRLFEGYYHDIIIDGRDDESLPQDVTKLICNYYPLFGTSTS